MAMTIGALAELAGVTVRTLHHYDELGLVRPSRRTDAGHRLYDAAAVERLQEVLFWRELDFPLDEIARLLSDPDHDRAGALREQHRLLVARAERTNRLVEALEATMNAHERGIALSDQELLEVFGEGFAERHDEHAAEAEQRWGETDAWATSRRRSAGYDRADWERIKREGDANLAAFAAAMRAGAPADGEDAMAAAEAARDHIDRWFYPCSHQMHVQLGEMYVADERFTRTYDDVEPGLAAYVRDAIVANAGRHG